MFDECESANDTDQPALAMKFKRLSELTAQERMHRFFSLYSTARAFVIAGIRHRYPDCSAAEMQKRKAALFLGRDYSLKRYNWDPEIEGY